VQLAAGAERSRNTPDPAELTDQERQALEIWRSLSPELREVVQGLPDLPEAVKAGIVAMVKASVKHG